MAVGSVRAFVLDVNDLDVAERFWAAVTGLPVTLSEWSGRYSRLGEVGGPGGSLLLQLVPDGKTAVKNRAHLDITVGDVAAGVTQVVELGGAVLVPLDRFPAPPDEAAVEWAVVTDPFGNEFCLVHPLTSDPLDAAGNAQ